MKAFALLNAHLLQRCADSTSSTRHGASRQLYDSASAVRSMPRSTEEEGPTAYDHQPGAHTPAPRPSTSAPPPPPPLHAMVVVVVVSSHRMATCAAVRMSGANRASAQQAPTSHHSAAWQR